MFFRTIRQIALLALLLSAASGCSEPKGNVTGLVSFNGSPLPAGKITFICEGGTKPVFIADIRDGKYEIKGVPPGQVKITVATFKPSQSVARPPGLGPTSRPETEETPKTPQEKYVEIPVRYGRAESSDLGYDMKPGDQEHNIPLAS
jgi:hypothetical protein